MSFQKVASAQTTQTVTDPTKQFRIHYDPVAGTVIVDVFHDEGSSFALGVALNDPMFAKGTDTQMAALAQDIVARVVSSLGYPSVPPDQLLPHPIVPQPEHGVTAAVVQVGQAQVAQAAAVKAPGKPGG